LTEAQTALAQATPAAMLPLRDGYRDHLLRSTSGGVAQRWGLLYAEHRRPQARRPVDKPRLQQGTAEVKACQQLCRTMFACEADAQQALRAFAQELQATRVQQATSRPMPRYLGRGRPSHAVRPAQIVSQSDGALGSLVAAREALVGQHRCVLLATNESDEHALSPQALLEGYNGQTHAERGFRFLKAPLCLASS
jgi:hypothetical protein